MHFQQHQQGHVHDWSDEDDNSEGEGSEVEDCPLCLEEMDESDQRFIPCPCGYQVQSVIALFYLTF